jgi:adenine-specific DNA glycosylase
MVHEASLGLSVTAHLGVGKSMVCAEPLQMQVLRDALMGWWQEHGRQTIPWKLNLDGSLPATGEQLDPYAIWVAEVMLHFATQEA